MIKPARCFDVQDSDIPPAVYQLMFAQDLQANDMWYLIQPDELLEYEDPDAWKKRMERGHNCCYHDSDAMKRYVATKPTYKQAVKIFHNWLKEQNVPINEPIFVKIWW